MTYQDCYLALGQSNKERADAYIELFRYDLFEKDMNNIRDTWQTGTPLGNDYFIEKLESQLLHKVGQTSRGRPRMNTAK